MADKRLDQVTKVTDMAYVPVIMSDGSIGQIAKANLATVVASVMNTNKMVQNIGLSGGATYKIGTNNDKWGRRQVSLFVVASTGAKFSHITIFFMSTYVYVYYTGDDPTSFGLSFGYNTDGTITSVYVKSSLNSDTTLACTAIGYNIVEKTTDTWSTTLTPTTDIFGYNTLAELSAGVAENLTMFQRVYHIPKITNAGWLFLGEVTNYNSALLLYSINTFVNTNPALVAVSACNFDATKNVQFNLVVGQLGGQYDPNIKYKIDDSVIKFWVRGSNVYTSELLVITGNFKYQGLIEEPPTDAIQPSI